jgi:hypothetical protein
MSPDQVFRQHSVCVVSYARSNGAGHLRRSKAQASIEAPSNYKVPPRGCSGS